MKKIIKIAHLYYDLMNLYGENGNIKALEKFIERQGVNVEIDRLSFDDEIDFKKYDFFYMGSGCEEAERLVLTDLIKYKKDIKKAIENDKMFLITGNAMELFGTKICLKEGGAIECLGILNYNSVEASKRLVSELFYEFDELEEGRGKNIVGFKNCNSNIVNNEEEKMFKFPDNVRYKNFFGMMFVGPVLIRNPYFTNYMLSILFKNKGYDFITYEDTSEFKAYHEFVNNFIVNSNLD